MALKVTYVSIKLQMEHNKMNFNHLLPENHLKQ